MDPQKLDDCLRELRARNQPIVAVVACACATPIGAFDPLAELADVCQRHGVWLHVDAAHGGCACLSPRHRHLVEGLERADSVVWDAHKMLFVPGLCAMVFYRDRSHRFETFRQEAPYLFDPVGSGTGRVRQWAADGRMHEACGCVRLVGRLVVVRTTIVHRPGGRHVLARRQFLREAGSAADFTPLHEPQCNIVVFRYTPEATRGWPPEQLGKFQFELRRG